MDKVSQAVNFVGELCTNSDNLDFLIFESQMQDWLQIAMRLMDACNGSTQRDIICLSL